MAASIPSLFSILPLGSSPGWSIPAPCLVSEQAMSCFEAMSRRAPPRGLVVESHPNKLNIRMARTRQVKPA